MSGCAYRPSLSHSEDAPPPQPLLSAASCSNCYAVACFAQHFSAVVEVLSHVTSRVAASFSQGILQLC